MSRARVGVLISGRGSNMQALVEATRDPAYPAEIVAVASNNPDAPGLAFAREHGIDAFAVDHRPFGKDRAAHEAALDAALRERGVEWIALAGYMRVLTAHLVGAWSGRMLNIHPSLLPSFPGLHTHERVLEAGGRVHGCTVHLVSEGVDEGPILGQAALAIQPGDTPDVLASRVLELEHKLYPACLALAVSGQRDQIMSGPAAKLFAF
jgi:phosphoribosylglycinamide formyltransferase-1